MYINPLACPTLAKKFSGVQWVSGSMGTQPSCMTGVTV